MRRTLFLSVIVLCATWVFAQTSSTQNPSSTQSSSSTSSQATNSGSETITGCLSGSSGNYTLTDKSGTAYQLTGDTNGMNDHVGHTIKVTGTKSSASPSSSNSIGSSSNSSSTSSSGTGSQNTFNVSSFKHVSKTCNSTH